MFRFILACFIGLSIPLYAQEPLIERDGDFREPGVSSLINMNPQYPLFHQLTWGPTSLVAPAVCTIKLEQHLNGVWGDLIPPQDCTVAGVFREISSRPRLLRMSVTALSVDGRVGANYKGFDGAGCGKQYNGIISVITGSDPAPGTELAATVSPTERWRVLSAHFELITDSTASDRNVFFSLDFNGNEYFRTLADGQVQANQRGIYTASALGFVGTAGLGPSSVRQNTSIRTILIPIQQDTFIPGGHNVRTVTEGLQSGDDYSAATLLVERCSN